MKKLIFFLLIIFSTLRLDAQDLILTAKNDSISCRIKEVQDGEIFFVPKGKRKKDKTSLLLSQIKKYEYDYYRNKKNKPAVLFLVDSAARNYPRFRLSINGGYSFQTVLRAPAGSTLEYIEHKRNLRSGMNIGADVAYYFTSFLGIGAKFTGFQTKSTIENFTFSDAYGNKKNIMLSDNTTVSYYGLVLSTRYLHNDNKYAFISNISLGYLRYLNDSVMLSNTRNIGNTLGFVIDLGYDVTVYKNISFGIQFSFLLGSLSEVSSSSNGGDFKKILLGNTETLNRLDFSAGLRYNF